MILIDTNVISESWKLVPDPRVLAWIDAQAIEVAVKYDQQHTQWLAAEIQAAIDDPRPSIPHAEVMAEMEAKIAVPHRIKVNYNGATGGANLENTISLTSVHATLAQLIANHHGESVAARAVAGRNRGKTLCTRRV